MMYKKIAALVVAGLLCLNFSGYGQARDVVGSGLVVGDKVPDLVLAGVYNLNEAEKNNVSYIGPASISPDSIRISDFRGKLLILDFWATWCGACISMVPRMDSLLNAYGDKLAILSVAYQKAEEVIPFLDNLEKKSGLKSKIPIVTDDKTLRNIFPHRGLPHYVWINDKGVVVAITGLEELTDANVRKLIGLADGAQSGNVLRTKKDLMREHDNLKPFLFNGNGGEVRMLRAHSMLTGYSEGLVPGLKMRRDEKERRSGIICTNQSLYGLFSKAWRDKGIFTHKKIKFEGKDSLAFVNWTNDSRAYIDWLKSGRGWCYELWLPTDLPGYTGYDDNYIGEMMRMDLLKYFPQYTAAIEKRILDCYVVESVNKRGKVIRPLRRNGEVILQDNKKAIYRSLSTTPIIQMGQGGFKAENIGLDHLLYRLNAQSFSATNTPLVDMTGENTKVTMSYVGSTSDSKQLSAYFASQGLKLSRRMVETDVLVVRDKPNYGKGMFYE